MGKYLVQWSGHGKYRYSPKIKRISETKAKELEKKGEKVYNSKKEAEEDC